MSLHHSEISIWADEIKDFPNFIPIKVWNMLQFFMVKGSRTLLGKENLIPIPDLKYCVFSPKEERYYHCKYRGYNVDTLYFYRKNLNFSGEDNAVEVLRRYVEDGNVTLLLRQSQFTDIELFLQRLWKSHLSGDGQIRYRDYINLLEQSLRLEDYKSYSQRLVGYKTVVNQFETRIKDIWDECYKSSIPTFSNINK